MKSNELNNGITLVALVITIIILLILAGISISALTGSGLFKNTKLAKEKYENAEIEENVILGDYENKIVEYIDGSRQTGNIPIGETILWNYENDDKGLLTNAGATDGTEERIFSGYNVNDFDAVIVDAGSSDYAPDYIVHPLYISKTNFNKRMFGIAKVGSTYSWNTYTVKIDAEHNKICFLEKGGSQINILKVTGIKY